MPGCFRTMALLEATQYGAEDKVGVGRDWFRFSAGKAYAGEEYELLPKPRYDKQLLSFENVKCNLKIQQYRRDNVQYLREIIKLKDI